MNRQRKHPRLLRRKRRRMTTMSSPSEPIRLSKCAYLQDRIEEVMIMNLTTEQESHYLQQYEPFLIKNV